MRVMILTKLLFCILLLRYGAFFLEGFLVFFEWQKYFVYIFVRAAACFSHEVSEKKKVNRRLHERDVINSTKLSQIGLVTFYLFVVVARTDLKVSCAYPFYMQLR